MITAMVRVFLSLLVIMDPFGSIPIFLSSSKETEKRWAASYSVGVASLVFFLFLFLGGALLELLKIDLPSLQIAGGIILGALALQLSLGLSPSKPRELRAFLALIGTPMLTGPGTIVSTMLFVQEYGYLVVGLGGTLSLVTCWILLYLSTSIQRILRNEGLEILSKIMGLLLTAIAVRLITTGIKSLWSA